MKQEQIIWFVTKQKQINNSDVKAKLAPGYQMVIMTLILYL